MKLLSFVVFASEFHLIHHYIHNIAPFCHGTLSFEKGLNHLQRKQKVEVTYQRRHMRDPFQPAQQFGTAQHPEQCAHALL
jgi:hypothetical protein